MDVKPRRALAPRTDENNILPAVSQAQKLKLKGNTSSSSSLNNMAKPKVESAAPSNAPRRAAFGDKSNIANNMPLGSKNAKLTNIDVKPKRNSAPEIVQTKKQTGASSKQPLRPSAVGNAAPVQPKAKPVRAGVKKIDVYEDKKKKSPERAAAIVKALTRSSSEQIKTSAPRRPTIKKEEDIPQYSDQIQQPYDKVSELVSDDGSEADYDEDQENKYNSPELSSEDDGSQSEDDDDGYSTARSRPSDNTTGITAALAVPRQTNADKAKIESAKSQYAGTEDPEEVWDIRMVTEYGDEIFEYMKELEDKMLPNPNYMDHQNELQWSMRAILLDWLVQVHARLDLRPETLFLACNYIDRFLSIQVVSLRKLQLCGITALFIAAKYEEINCPSLQEMTFMVDYGFLPEEILKAERFMLSKLNYELGWPGPMSFLRRISRGDDYDIDTRTLAKYFLEVCLMDERFIGCPPSYVAAVSHCMARIMLGKGHWTLAHVYYSGYTANQLYPSLQMLMECCENQHKHHSAVNEKYRDKVYWNASGFVETFFKKGGKLPSRDKI